MKVLFASSEAVPYAASGGLADVAGALPKALRRRLIGCRVVLPLYEAVSEEMRESMRFLGSVTVPVAWRRQYCGVFEAKHDGVIYYLLDNQYYFKREGLYGHYDDAERFAFFSRAVLEILPLIDFWPDVIHCNDWQTALTPVYLKLFYYDNEPYKKMKTVFTIHNIQYQGQYDMQILEDVVGIPGWAKSLVEYNGAVNLMKGGIEACDQVTTVSPTYAQEILDPWYAYGLEGILKERTWKLQGILNGIDTENYDPAADPAIAAPYSAEDPAGKRACKEALLREMNLPFDEAVPVVGMVSRLVGHKGLDLVKYILEELLIQPIQFVVLGSGECGYETFFREMAERHPDKVAFRCGFVPALSRRIYAGSDLFLMPSKSEPCGLSQLIALRYGAIPVVRETGGLNDTITDVTKENGNGFTFFAYNAHDMGTAVTRGAEAFGDKEKWNILVRRAMECDNSWNRSADEYIKLYRRLTKKQGNEGKQRETL